MSTIQRTELRLMRWLRKRELNLVTLFFHICTELGSSKGWTLFSLCVIFGLDFSFGWAIGLSSLFGAFCAQLIKRQVKRKRPCLHPNAPPALARVPYPWSFPSGHTATAFSVAGMLWCIGHAWCWPFTLFALIVGFSRIYLGVHYPSDVCFGAILGILCGCIFGTIW